MSIDDIRDALPEYARDLRLNLGSVLTVQGAPGLTSQQIWGTALAAAIAARNVSFAQTIERAARAELDAAQIDGAKAAAAIMAMNNIYYRFTHLASSPDYRTMPAKLRMNVIAKPGVEKVDFELWSLAVSAVNGCGMCIDSHEKILRQAGVSAEAVQAALPALAKHEGGSSVVLFSSVAAAQGFPNHASIGMAKSLDIVAAAEGIETEEQLATNTALGRPHLGVGARCRIKGAIIDKNARIGDAHGIDDGDAAGRHVFDGAAGRARRTPGWRHRDRLEAGVAWLARR